MKVTSGLATRRLGRTGLEVTELGLGGYMFTGEFGVPRAEAEAIVDRAFAAGINYADTAAMYGFGEGEELVARAVQRHPDRTIHVSSKVGWLDRTVVRHLGDAAYRDEDALRRAVLHSLWLLRRDRIEIMMVHEPDWPRWGLDPRTGEAPVVRVLEALKREGVIGAIGLGGWNCATLASLIDTGRFDCALVAGGYTLVEQPVRTAVLAAAKRHDVGLIMGGTFLQGLLAVQQRSRLEQIQRLGNYGGRFSPALVKRLLAIYDLGDETGLSITEMAIRFILGDKDIHTIIPGAQTVGHLQENLAAAARGPLPAEVAARIEAISLMEATAEEAREKLQKPGPTMRGVLFVAKGQAALQEEPAPACGPGQILCRTLFSGLTNGTERNVLMGGNYGGTWPGRCGYQTVGRVIEVGAGVQGYGVGDVVYSGNFHQHVAFFAAHVGVPTDPNNLLLRLPAGVEPRHAALFGMASVAMHDVRRAGVRLGDRVLVVGAGCIGLFTAQCARAAGAKVTVCDVDERRLAIARQLGAHHTAATVDEAAWQALRAERGPFDVVFEDSGAPILDRIIGATWGQGLVRHRGTVVLIAGRSRIDYSFNAGQGAELAVLQASHFERSDLEELCRLVIEGVVQVAPLLQDVVPIAAAVALYDRLRDTPNTLLGTVFDWSA